MATTMTAPVNNSIALASAYLPILDEVYKRGSLTSVLDTSNERVRFIGAKTVNLYKTNMVGMANYQRNGGFVTGDVNGTWEQKTLNVDRGRSYHVDVMDNDETLGMAFGTLVGEVIRTQVTPEVDAYRFATYAGATGVSTATPAALTSSTNVADLIDTGLQVMGDDEVTEDNILFLSETAYRLLKGNITRYVANSDRMIEKSIGIYEGMPVIVVPQKRFYTGCVLLNPTSSSEIGGYENIGAKINFLIVNRAAILQVMKHVVPRIFSPEVNQEADAWKFDYRNYHDCWVLDNKVKGIYVHAAPAFTLSATTATVATGSTTTATITGSTGTITIVSSDTSVATATESSGTITITGVAAGTAKLKIVDGNGSIGYITVTVS